MSDKRKLYMDSIIMMIRSSTLLEGNIKLDDWCLDIDFRPQQFKYSNVANYQVKA
jgi:hypothetical protein